MFKKGGPLDKLTRKMDKNVTKWVAKNIGDGGEAEVAAAEQARHQAETAREQAQAEQQAAVQREAEANAQREAAEAARAQAEAREVESQRVAEVKIREAQVQHQEALNRQAMALAQQEASDAEARALQAQLDAVLKANKASALKLQLAQLQQPEPAAAVVKPAEVEQKSAPQEDNDPVLEVAIAESLSHAAQPAAAPSSSPPSYDEIEAINQSALEAAILASQAETKKASSTPAQLEFAAAGVNSSSTPEAQDESLDEGIATSLSNLLSEQIRKLTVNMHESRSLPDSVRLTQEQFNALQTYLFEKFPFTSPSAAGGPVRTAELQSFAAEWLEEIESHLVGSEAESNLTELTGLGAPEIHHD